MISGAEAWRAMEENEEAFFSLWCNTIDMGSGLIFHNTSFSDDPLFNHLTRISCSYEDVDDLIERVVELFQTLRITPRIYVSPLTKPQNLSSLLIKRGFRLHDNTVIMVLEDGEHVEEGLIQMEKVNENSLETWSRAFAEAFDIPESWMPELRVRCSAVVSDRRAQLYLGSIVGKPAGTIALFSEKKVGGIYCVGTVPAFRRSGVATFLLAKTIEHSQRLGNSILCLQSLAQDDLSRFYERRGFKPVFTREVYVLEDGG